MSQDDIPPPVSGNGSRLVVGLAWPVLALVIVILGLSIGLAALPIILSPSEEIARITTVVAEGRAIARVVALIIIVPAICVLSMLDKINGAAAIAALSAIAGYVLGGTTGGSNP
jgi:hypothetical protein